uniref:F-box associated beta-propeller type 1 domain-containing protein n=1 Tax=Brassica oleracea TaxID=3712 RepID=A0A3P6BZX2_BRAOL|nr:unnamed protein product [Brassica oleracea]
MKFNFGSFDIDWRESYGPEAEVYEFSSNSWREIGIIGDWSLLRPSMMVSVDGNSYWLASPGQARDQTTIWEKFFDVTGHHLPMVPAQSFFIKNKMIVMLHEDVVEEGTAHLKHQMQTETFRHSPSITCLYSPSLVSVPF